MPVPVMIIVLFAALLHATWNFLVKKTDDKYLSMSAVVIGHAPFAAIAILFSPFPSPESLLYVFIGSLLHAGYQLFLLASYRLGDLSQVYPLARGISPLIVAAVSVIILGVPLSSFELAGIFIIATGISSLSLVRRHNNRCSYHAVFFSLMTGGFIAGYSLIDGIGARLAGTSLGFYGCLSLINTLVFAVIMRFLRPGTIKKVFRVNAQLALKGGGASFFAYALVIWAFTQAPIALVTSLRETSIIFAMLLGIFILRERFGLVKVMATLFIVLGMVMLRLKI